MISALFVPVLFISAVITNILISLFVYIRNPRSATHILFVVLGITISIWLSVHYVSTLVISQEVNLIWIRMSIMIAAFMEFMFLLLALTLPSNKIHTNKYFLLVLGFLTLLVMSLAISPFAFTSVEIINDHPNPKPGPAIAIFASYVIFAVFGSAIILFKRSKKVMGRERKQLRLLMLGMLLMNGLMIFTVLIPIALFQDNTFVSLAPFYTLLFLGITAYTIIRHRLMDIGLLAARSVTYFLLVAILGSFYVIGLRLIQIYFIPASDSNINLVISVLFTLIIAFTFQPLRKYLEKVTEKIFYRSSYDPNKLLQEINKDMASTLDLYTLSDKLLRKLCDEMKIRSAFLVLTKNNRINWINYFGEVKIHEKFVDSEISSLIEWIVKSPGESVMVSEDIEVSKEKDIFQKYKLDVILPLVVKDEIIGAILLDRKSSGEVYSYEDVNVLKIMAPEIGIAVKNALSYDEIKRFNITLKEEVERQTIDLRNANEQLKQLDKLKDEFVSLASHELRTPMTIIKSYIWMFLHKKGDELDEKEKSYLVRAYSTTERLIKLVNDMLNVSRIESGRLKLEMKDLDIVKLVSTVIEELIPRAKELGLSLTLVKQNEIVKKVNGDADRIEEILINFLGNSLKFTPPGGSIRVSLAAREKDVLISVADNGKGIKKEDMPRLFHKFETMGNAYLQKQQNQGSGLGLYLSKSLIELHGGKVNVESAGENKGSVFSFTLPYNEDKPHQEAEVLPSKSLANGSGVASAGEAGVSTK